MDIVVRGKNVEVSPRLRKLAREKIRKIARFTHDAGRVEVDFSELRNRRVADNQVCDVIVHLKRNFVKAHAAAADALRRAGVNSVIAVTAARTPRPGTAPRVRPDQPAYTRPMAAGSRRNTAGIP